MTGRKRRVACAVWRGGLTCFAQAIWSIRVPWPGGSGGKDGGWLALESLELLLWLPSVPSVWLLLCEAAACG